MDADRFSLKARRTTRIPLRIPVVIVVEDKGKSRSLDGWTMIVNVHGAKIECKHRFGMHDEVTIQVPFNGMSQQGKVVWSKSEPNQSGNYEFGVELDCPDNLWGVGFPPSDWETTRSSKADAATAAILELAPPGVELAPPGVTLLQPSADDSDPSPASQDESSEPQEFQIEPEYSTAPEKLVQTLDLSEEFSAFHQQAADCPQAGSTTEFSDTDLSPEEEQSVMGDLENAVAPEEVQPASSPSPAQNGAEMHPTRVMPMEAPVPNPSALSSALGQINPTDKLSAFFNELVDSALQAKVLGLIEGVEKRIANRITEIESSSLSRIEEQVQGIAARHGEAMEQRAIDYLGSEQEALERNVREYLATAEDGARHRQQEQLARNQQAMQDHAAALTQDNAQRLDQHASELIATTQQGLRTSMEQQLPEIEKNLLDRCRVQGERMMAAQVEQWSLLFSDRVEQARQAMQKRLDETMNEEFARHAAALDARLEEHLTQAGMRLEQQLNRIGTQVRQTYLRHIVTELGRTQQVWIQQSQRQLEKLVLENLERSRRRLSQYLKSFGESLIQQASVTEETVEDPAPRTDLQAELPLEQNLIEVLPEGREGGA